ncbi:MAG: divergent polysaccharide deacetylase family protein [Minwuia sp.]|uniref:divergent polysaccharide deacetylase family protein n=1 Tax=Minwuia sp. TaxID=2493630 RepID=UPI003A8587B2
MADRGRRPAAQTALLIVAPLLALLYAGVIGWLWWAGEMAPEGAGPPPVAEAPSEPEPAAAEEKPADKTTADHGSTGHAPAEREADEVAGKPEGDGHAASTGEAAPDPQHRNEPPHADAAERSTDPAEAMREMPKADAPRPAAQPAPRPDRPSTPNLAGSGNGRTPLKDLPVVADSQDRKPLAPAPDPELTDRGRYGPLPKRGPDGRMAWRVYGHPFTRNTGDRLIAIVISELGLAETPTLSAIQDLPGEITLAFSPYSKRLDEWVPAARAAGHEVLLEVPMEPRNTELMDPGDKALMTTNSPEINLDRLGWVLSRATGYVGVTSFMGSRMTVSPRDMRPILDVLADRGLVYIDPKVTPVSVAGKLASEMGVPAATSDRLIDQQAARDSIDSRLAQLEQLSLAQGSAIGFAQAYPVTIERLRVWIPEMLKRGFRLAPITAVVRQE